MIVFSMLSVIALASVQSAAANNARAELLTCLEQSVEQAKSAKVAPDAFAAFAGGRCSAPAASLKAALVAFDVKNKVPRNEAETDAQGQVDEFVQMAGEKYARTAPKP